MDPGDARLGIVVRPLVLVLTALAATFGLYLIGPFAWPHVHRGLVILLVSTVWLAILCGFWWGVCRPLPSAVHHRRLDLRRLVVVGLVANLVSFPIALRGYTGQWLGNLSFRLADQGVVYRQRYLYLVSGADPRSQIIASLARGLAAPLIFGALILGMRYWRVLSTRHRVMVVGSAFVQVAYSFVRGTDKETADLIIFLVVALMAGGQLTARDRLRRLSFLFVGSVLFLGLFAARRTARGGSDVGVCIPRSAICAFPAPSSATPLIGDRLYMGWAYLNAYLTQGYHGLALAQDLRLNWTFGLSAVPPVSKYLPTSDPTGDFMARTYQTRLTDLGWDGRFQWSTLITQLANDVSFPGVPIALFLAAYVLARAWRASLRGDAAAHVIATYLVLVLLYIPANNQLTVSSETMASFTTWAAVWAVTRRRPLVIS